ncbi:hypothetical protein CDD80_3340 [Ophiocordyceps camponoti-rufipedis]|uniref:Uncharacterized protein n=1 Tax=Ophiocordyceps camponoti-rufipedis TaxID=2004952 RepID=A0A2C5Y7M0_9HYPO|nr:hypothetical protein CDD80_3340 [Ophiocordyceps camponoti-rufipedis]
MKSPPPVSPTKAPVLRRQTNGIPSNPREKMTMVMSKREKNKAQSNASKAPQSVVHRPRPVPRKQDAGDDVEEMDQSDEIEVSPEDGSINLENSAGETISGNARLQVADGSDVRASESRLRPPTSRTRLADSALLTDEDDGRETVIMMLDQSAEHEMKLDQQVLFDTEPKTLSRHRRVGEDCPVFSDRRATRSKLMSIPPPLPLGGPVKPRIITIVSPPALETPEEALDKIQQQLKRLEEVGTPALTPGLKQQGKGQEGVDAKRRNWIEDDAEQDKRVNLLADLEMEMGKQEDHWLEMRRGYSRTPGSGSTSSPNLEADAAVLKDVGRDEASGLSNVSSRPDQGTGQSTPSIYSPETPGVPEATQDGDSDETMDTMLDQSIPQQSSPPTTSWTPNTSSP